MRPARRVIIYTAWQGGYEMSMGKKTDSRLDSLKPTVGSLAAPYFMVSPAIFFLVIFTIYPLINLVYLSFFKFNLLSPKSFIGLSNYEELLFIRDDFREALINTAVFSLSHVFFLLLFALLFAVWFQRNTWLNRFAQTAVFTPHLVAMISCSMIFAWLMNDDNGLFNQALNFFRLPGLRWISSSKTAMMSVVIVSVWKGIGYYALVLLASLKAIPTEIYEAADLDNAGRAKVFFTITLPMLSPQLFFLLIMITINSFKVFDVVRIMTAGHNKTNVLAYYIYNQSFVLFKIGYASAAGVALMLILTVLTVIYFGVFSKKVHYQ
jgi:sn-glycerol 3-phosphate transport system permease protein